MASTFTPSDAIDMSKEKDWPLKLGLLDWDSTKIVFTKRTLIEFLKHTGTTVDPNFTNIAKLPRYAQFGNLSPLSSSSSTNPEESSQVNDQERDGFVPSRRVRTVPGGTHSDIFSTVDEGDALSKAPPLQEQEKTPAPVTEQETINEDESGINFTSSVKPSRRVRTAPGGTSILANFWDEPDQKEEFKPTRRVRQGPGGQDNVNGIF